MQAPFNFTMVAATSSPTSYTLTPPASLSLATGATSPLGWDVDFFDDFTGTLNVSGGVVTTGALYQGSQMKWVVDGIWGGYTGTATSAFSMSNSIMSFPITLSGSTPQTCSMYNFMNTNWGLWEAKIKCATTNNGANNSGVGTGWWLSGSQWCTAGEWDILETAQETSGDWSMNIHINATAGLDGKIGHWGGPLPSGNVYDGQFHIHQALMTPAYLAYYIDGTQVWTYNQASILNGITTATNPPKSNNSGSFGFNNNPYNSTWQSSTTIPNEPYYNIIIGSAWYGATATSAMFPCTPVQVDWIRHSTLYPATGGVHV